MKSALATLGLVACMVAAWGVNQLLSLLPLPEEGLSTLVLSLGFIVVLLLLVRLTVFFVNLLLGE